MSPTLTSFPVSIPAAEPATTDHEQARTIASQVLQGLEHAWNEGDGAAFGALYTDDATFVTIRGEHLTGRATIAAGHAGIFATIYAGSVNRMQLVRADRLCDDVVLSLALSTLDCPGGPLAGVHQARSTSVLTRAADGSWLVAATHNSLVVGA